MTKFGSRLFLDCLIFIPETTSESVIPISCNDFSVSLTPNLYSDNCVIWRSHIFKINEDEMWEHLIIMPDYIVNSEEASQTCAYT